MGEVLSAERAVLYWRTRRGRKTAIRYLDTLAVALHPQGRRSVKLYRPTPIPLPRVHAHGAEDIGILVSVLATPGGTWGYHEAPWGRRGYLYPCGDAKSAAEVVDDLLKHRMYPSTW